MAAKSKIWRPAPGIPVIRLPENQAAVNHDFTSKWEIQHPISTSKSTHGVRFVSASAEAGCCRQTGVSATPRPRRRFHPSEADSAREILELLELELGAMIRQLDRAAGSVAGGAEATAATLATIRQRTDALTGRSSAAQSTATTFSRAADKFTHSADGIGSQVRDAGRLADQANEAAREAMANVDRLRDPPRRSATSST